MHLHLHLHSIYPQCMKVLFYFLAEKKLRSLSANKKYILRFLRRPALSHH